MNSVVKLVTNDVDAIPFQEASLDIWEKKYRLVSKSGDAVDKTMDDTYKRVARALADVEPEAQREVELLGRAGREDEVVVHEGHRRERWEVRSTSPRNRRRRRSRSR